MSRTVLALAMPLPVAVLVLMPSVQLMVGVMLLRQGCVACCSTCLPMISHCRCAQVTCADARALNRLE